MNQKIFSLIIFIYLFCFSGIQAQKLENILYELPDVIFSEMKIPKGYEKAYRLKIKQPIDHFDLSRGYFYQNATLYHKGFDHPSVIITEGYDLDRDTVYELTALLKANQLDVEHRFFGKSKPDSIPYDCLNMKQATADFHYINQLFRNIYKNKWICTGISKGGTTAIIYRYFYPNDVDVSVPYVAPLNNGLEDKRVYTFLDTVGTDECRKKIFAFQKKMLENRDKVIPLLRFYSLGADLSFNYLSLEEAFEYSVMEYSFSFWQFGRKCSDIPDIDSSLEKAVKHLIRNSSVSFFSDEEFNTYGSHYFQAGTEMGYYGYETYKFKELIKALPTDKNPLAIFMPKKAIKPFDGTLLKKVHEWVKTSGNKFIYIYGGSDTWSACAVFPTKNLDAKWFFLKGKNHFNARIVNMTDAERQELVSTLEKWLSVQIE